MSSAHGALVSVFFMPSVTAIASKTKSMCVGLVVRVGTGGRAGGIPMWLCRVLRSFAFATLWSRVRLLRAMLCGIERCFLDARVQFMCCWPCSGCVRRSRLSRGVYIFQDRSRYWTGPNLFTVITMSLRASQITDSLSAVRGLLYSVKLLRSPEIQRRLISLGDPHGDTGACNV